MLEQKLQMHQDFWNGIGPNLILIPRGQQDLYDLDNYRERFFNPLKMWESEIKRARPLLDWPTDGIPSVRPNLGVVFVPAMAGQSYEVVDNSMPWPGTPLTENHIRDLENKLANDQEECDIARLAREFYQTHQQSGENEIAPYLPDTQGVFDIAHLLRGDEIFMELADPARADWIAKLMDISFGLYRNATRKMKRIIGETRHSMMHGHGTPQGVHFPKAGVRIAEDTATLLSPDMIRNIILPAVKRCAEEFGGVFLHYCGWHGTIFRQFAELPEVKAVDLGNPEKYDTRKLLEICTDTNTVLYSRIAPTHAEEDWRSYIQRLAGLVKETGARVILRPLVVPQTREECTEMQDMWRQETS